MVATMLFSTENIFTQTLTFNKILSRDILFPTCFMPRADFPPHIRAKWLSYGPNCVVYSMCSGHFHGRQVSFEQFDGKMKREMTSLWELLFSKCLGLSIGGKEKEGLTNGKCYSFSIFLLVDDTRYSDESFKVASLPSLLKYRNPWII